MTITKVFKHCAHHGLTEYAEENHGTHVNVYCKKCSARALMETVRREIERDRKARKEKEAAERYELLVMQKQMFEPK